MTFLEAWDKERKKRLYINAAHISFFEAGPVDDSTTVLYMASGDSREGAWMRLYVGHSALEIAQAMTLAANGWNTTSIITL